MFLKARLQLTFFYITIITFIIVVFSLVLFNYTALHIRDTVEEDTPTQQAQERIIDHTIDRLQQIIVVADIATILLAGLLSYWLAGKTLRPIQTALHAQEKFSAHASHELRTPLAVMKTENEVFLKNKQPSIKDAQDLARSNVEEIDRMKNMVENLLVLARSKESSVTIKISKVDVNALLTECVKKLQKSIDDKHLIINKKIQKNIFALGDEKLLEQLFFNIIQNAITYTEKGEIVITAFATDTVIVEIRDSGIGIETKDLPHIYEPFYKADASRTVTSNGVGLGLSIVRQIVERHKGTIHVQSELGKGTTVTVTLPTYS